MSERPSETITHPDADMHVTHPRSITNTGRHTQRPRVVVAALLALSAAASAAAERTGVVIRESTLRADPYPAAEPLATLTPGTEFSMTERAGIWARAEVAGRDRGWVKLPDVRLAPPTAPATPAAGEARAQGPLSRIARSVTALIGGRRERAVDRPATATIGIRGLTVADIENARPDTRALAATEDFRATRQDAIAFAREGGLERRVVPESEAPR